MDIERLTEFLQSNQWNITFEVSALRQGHTLARARLVNQATGEFLPGDDAEIRGYLTDKTRTQYETTLIFWIEQETLQMESECSCAQSQNCQHAAALIEYLLRANHLAEAFDGSIDRSLAKSNGESQSTNIPQAAKKTYQTPLTKNTPSSSSAPSPSAAPPEHDLHSETPSQHESPRTTAQSQLTPEFLIRIERKPASETYSWLPEIYAHAYALYGSHKVSLEPSGLLPPIIQGSQKIRRQQNLEMQACQLLYALDLIPGAEEAPPSLKKLAKPPHAAKLWAIERKKWPSPDFYWQRFRHEGVPALESRGWRVEFSAHVGLKPLVFRTDTWRADIVEEGKGWFHLSAGFEINGEAFELQPILATLVEQQFLELTKHLPKGQEFLIFLPDGRGLALPVGRFRNILETLGRLVNYQFSSGPIRVQKTDAAALTELEDLGAEAPETLYELSEAFENFRSITALPVPDGLQAELRPYQLEGYYWMQFLKRHDLHGILADDMGLGKTLQCLTHILHVKQSRKSDTESLPSLVLAPTSVVLNWQREASKFTPQLSVLVLQGPKRHQHFSEISSYDLVLTSYALLPRDMDAYSSQLFELIALDEAQHIKNAKTQIGQSVRKLNSHQRLCLSGTPVENHLGELWSLMDFLMPDLLGSHEEFNEQYRTPIEKQGKQNQGQSQSRAAELLAKRIGPLILRRTKHDVAKELPPKTEVLQTIPLNEDQKDLYETVRSTMDKQVRAALAAATGNQSNIVFLDALLKLRQICSHPSLLDSSYDHVESAKFHYFKTLLGTLLKEKHRVLVFSQFTSMLQIIEDHIKQLGISYLKLTGETKNRQDLVEQFQSGEADIFLISLKAGGTGLTLTGADTVIHYDPWWNPAAQNQATDRAYRIGQTKPVIVHKLICQDTVEERIHQMQDKKQGLADNVFTGATRQLSLDEDTLKQLLSS